VPDRKPQLSHKLLYRSTSEIRFFIDQNHTFDSL